MRSLALWRRLVMLGVFGLFLLQYLRIDWLVGSLTGSVVFGAIGLLDVFAFVESQLAGRGVTVVALLAVLPVIGLYLLFGRAFCGWICPMDMLFSGVGYLRRGRGARWQVAARWGYLFAGVLLLAALLLEVPWFSRYLSHLTNIFRAIGSAVLLGEAPAASGILLWSLAMLALLVLLESLMPRLWCRVLCPVGKTYGLFNRVSRLRLRMTGARCSGCLACEAVCYMGVDIARQAGQGSLRDANCIYCGRCQQACGSMDGVIGLGFRK